MASAPRGFIADAPVLVTTRAVLRACLFDHEEVMRQVMRLLSLYAEKCHVRLYAWVLGVNHIHLLLSQSFHGHDKARKKGISPFVRNFASAFAKWLNGYLSSQGRLFERVFDSVVRTNAAEVLSSLAYILMNPEHHRDKVGAEDYLPSSARVYFHGSADGVTTDLPGIFSEWKGTAEEKARRLAELVKAIWSRVKDPRMPNDLAQQTRAVLARRPGEVRRDGWNRAVPIGRWVGEEEARIARDRVRSHLPAWEPFRPRRAPRIGSVIEIRVSSDPHRRLASLSWREDSA